MGLFSKKKESESEKSVSQEEKVQDAQIVDDKKAVKSDSAKNKKNKKVLHKDSDGALAYKFLLKPWITEKTHELMSNDKYVFRIRPNTTKNQVKNAVEKLYNVGVVDTNIINIQAKKRRFGRSVGKKSAVKKAIVTLKRGDKIEVFE